jgi:hypothetical protein
LSKPVLILGRHLGRGSAAAPDPILATQGGSRRKARQSHRNLVVDQVAGDDDPVYDATVIVEGGLIKDVLTSA